MPHFTLEPIAWAASSVLALGIVVSFWAHLRARWRWGPVSRRAEGWFSAWGLRLAGSALCLSVVVALVAPDLVLWSRLPLSESMRWGGLGLGAAGVLGCAWVFTRLGRNLTDTVQPRRGNALVTSGPYRRVRHPLYAFGTLAWFGLAVAAASWPALCAEAVAVAFLVARSRREERLLIAVHGESYRRYRRGTGGFMPRPGRSYSARR